MHPLVERRVVSALAVISLLEAAIAAAPWLIDPARLLAGSAKQAQPTVAASASPVGEVQPIQSFTSFIGRPLFTATRRPAPAALASRGNAAAPFQQGQMILGRYRLTGIVVTPKVRMAFVTDTAANKSITVTEGEKLGDWVFIEITRDSITMQSDGRRNVVALRAPAGQEGTGR